MKTLFIGLLIFLIFTFTQSLLLLFYILYVQDDDLARLGESLTTVGYSGSAIAMAEIPSAIIGVWFVIYFSAKKNRLTAKEYLKLNIPTVLNTLKWLGVMVLVIITMEITNTVLERDTPDFMSKIYESTDNFLLLWIAVIIAAPIFEEFLFRGFIFEGLRHSRVGMAGAIIIPAASWAIIHLQYGWFEIITIFLIGIILAIAKYRTESLYIPIFMHMLMNLTASVFMEY